VTAVFIPVKGIYIGYNLRSQRVKMDVTNQFPEIDIFLADAGFVTVLKNCRAACTGD
jgi:hypothetical protein